MSIPFDPDDWARDAIGGPTAPGAGEPPPPLFDPDGSVTDAAAARWIDEAGGGEVPPGPGRTDRWRTLTGNPVVFGGLGGLALLVVGATVVALLSGGSSDRAAVTVPRTRAVPTTTVSTTPRPTAAPVASAVTTPPTTTTEPSPTTTTSLP